MKTKIATSIEQSKKLLELGLDADTADMWYLPIKDTYELVTSPSLTRGIIPAWSLSVLINLMPEVIEREDKRKATMTYVPSFSRVISPHSIFYRGDNGAMDYAFAGYNNGKNDLVDACCNMLGWLIKQGYIKTEKEMSKIEEMADAYGRENPFTWYDADAEINKDTNSPAIAYSDGAHAVLVEIESIVINNEDNTLCMARCLVDKIKELKGE